MADVQIEHGYTKLANEILQQMALTKLSPIQYRIIFVIWRYTYGFNRKEHEFSLNFISNATNYDKRQLQRELTKLENKKIIIQKVRKGKSRLISFNKNYDEWLETETVGKPTNGKTTNSGVGRITNGAIGNPTNQEINNLNKNLNKSSSSSSKKSVFDFYHKNLQVGVSSSPFVYEQIEHWINDVTSDLVLAAMKLSAKKEKRGFDYTEGILKKWVEAGVESIEDARKFEQSFKKGTRKAGYKKPISKEDFDLSE